MLGFFLLFFFLFCTACTQYHNRDITCRRTESGIVVIVASVQLQQLWDVFVPRCCQAECWGTQTSNYPRCSCIDRPQIIFRTFVTICWCNNGATCASYEERLSCCPSITTSTFAAFVQEDSYSKPDCSPMVQLFTLHQCELTAVSQWGESFIVQCSPTAIPNQKYK